MLLKALNGFSQAIIIVLAFVLIITITTKHSSNAALEDFQKQVEERFQANDAMYNNKIKLVEDNLNRYQQLREQRAQLFGARLDEIYALYKKDPNPIDQASPQPPALAEQPKSENKINDKTLNYMEQKCNKVEEKVDTNYNRLNSRLDILEQRVNLLNSASKTGNIKVVQNNLQTVNNK